MLNQILSLRLLLLMCALGLSVVADPLHARVYKWTDANGQVHYSQTPPPAKASTSGKTEVMDNLSRKYYPRSQDGDTYCAQEKLHDFNSYNVNHTIIMLIEEKHRLEEWIREESDTEERDILRCKVQFYRSELDQHRNRIQQIRNEYESLEERRGDLSESKRTSCYSESSLLVGEKAREMARCLDRHQSLGDIERRLRELKDVYFAIKEKLND